MVSAVSSGATIFDTAVSDMQSGLTVNGHNITGNLKYLSSGQLVTAHGAGHFMALQFSNFDTSLTSVKVGMYPSASGQDLQEILTDPDKNGAWKVTNKDTQSFKVVSTDGVQTKTEIYNLSGLVFLYTADELNAMTISEIKAIAEERGYTITETTKADIITEFLAQQNA